MNLVSALVGWVLLAMLVGLAARSRGRDYWSFFGWSLIGSPIIAVAALLIVKPTQREKDRAAAWSGLRPCPHCQEYVKREARRCRHCQHELAELEPMLVLEQCGIPSTPTSAREGLRYLAVTVGLLACGAALGCALYALGV